MSAKQRLELHALCYLCLQLDVQLLHLLVVVLLQLLQSQFSLNTDRGTRDAVQ